MLFRLDINALRAFAVIAVVLFHFNESWLPGGFAGVDVFFVISGFLMTGIIITGIEKNNFSILEFYVARANRIIPPLAFMCLLLSLFGFFYLTPNDFATLGKHIASSITFLSNIVYWRESGYFDAASHEKWLLHTWSLSVEWQFYIIYPLILVALKKLLSLSTIKKVIVGATIFSFIFSIFATYKWPSASYFLLPTRAWEMMIGGVAFIYPIKLRNEIGKYLSYIGLALIFLSYVFISKNDMWPGYLALIPVLGTFLVIQANQVSSRINNNFVIQNIGKWSYSIYLWHWPLVVPFYYFAVGEDYVYVGLFMSVLLGYLSFKYIERFKFRKDFCNLRQITKFKPGYFALLTGLIGVTVFAFEGLKERYQLEPALEALKPHLVMPMRDNGYCFYSFHNTGNSISENIGTDCYLGADKSSDTPIVSTLLFGDSYAGHNEPFWDEIFKFRQESFQSISTNWCIASFSNNYTGPISSHSYQQCLLNRKYLHENMHKYKNIIFAGAWGGALEQNQLDDFKAVAKKAAEMDINIIIMAAPISYKQNPLKLFWVDVYAKVGFELQNVLTNDTLTAQANHELAILAKEYSNVKFLYRDYLFNDDNTFDVNGISVPYSLDRAHISLLGSKKSAEYFMSQEVFPEIMMSID
ncbi:acyltransferase family protein [Thalassotalea ponticola]|uniref:acyltransferase family protein n=1 Tax=Thalassotalea ponticola TaxID=1523392 RepID=UPI0025B30B6C|nr:acyltransferase family protein [Thalassotalea ponticola]MDN3652663.1 acyltransferase family protein [Thalassotalea ponticola]